MFTTPREANGWKARKPPEMPELVKIGAGSPEADTKPRKSKSAPLNPKKGYPQKRSKTRGPSKKGTPKKGHPQRVASKKRHPNGLVCFLAESLGLSAQIVWGVPGYGPMVPEGFRGLLF